MHCLPVPASAIRQLIIAEHTALVSKLEEELPVAEVEVLTLRLHGIIELL